MKKILFIMLLPIIVNAQDTVRIKHSNYQTVFSRARKYPVLVEWWVTKNGITCTQPFKRSDNFSPDPLLKDDSNLGTDYVGSGFDRGHIAPAADNQCVSKQAMDESFYFTNMAPQRAGLNRGAWKMLEEHTRDLAKKHDSVFVQSGCVGVETTVKRLSIPTHCWKITTVKSTNEVTAYVFRNIPDKSPTRANHIVPIDSVRRLTKLNIR
jgi:endonuclease G